MTQREYSERLQLGCYNVSLRDVGLFRSYYQSWHWERVRTQQLERQPTCERCGRPARDCHHVRYRFFRETPEHLQSLCRECHERIHNGFF